MLTKRNLQELLDFQSDNLVLSLYLSIDPSSGTAETHKLELRSMLKETDLFEDAAIIERYFDHEFAWTGRVAAVFSCSPDNFFRAYSLPIPIRSRTRVHHRPYVKPLADVFDNYGGYGVALVDKQGARLFNFHLGTLKEQEGISGDSVRTTKRGEGSQSVGRRSGQSDLTSYTSEVTDRNMKDAARFAASFFGKNNIRRVLIGGTEDNIALFRNRLPKSWQSLIVGTFPMNMSASHDEVLKRSMNIGVKAESKREAKLVDIAITNAAKDKGGVLGLDETLSAIHDGRVQTLLVHDGFKAPGYRCRSCGFITSKKIEVCTFCNGQFDNIPDAVETAVRKVLQAGGEVEVLHGNAKLISIGQIAALLRY